jgi:hypothetical protein
VNYLALCVRAKEEAGMSGDGPFSVLSQQGQFLRMVNWISQAWIDVQLMRPNWNFMHSEFILSTVEDQRDYQGTETNVTDLKLWDVNSVLIHDPDLGYSDQHGLQFYRYQLWRSKFRSGMESRPTARPSSFTLTQENKIRFEPKPDKIYTIEGEYKRSTQTFAADTDVPTGLPDDFHTIIVWQALKYYAHYENAPEVLEEAETNFDNLLFRLENEQLPEMSEDYETLA